MNTLEKFLDNCNIEGSILYDESMALHTTFKIGGKADAFVKPKNIKSIQTIIQKTKEQDIPLLIVGAGANLLVKDEGIRGIVLSTENLNEVKILEKGQKDEICVYSGSGLHVTKLAKFVTDNGLCGMEFAGGLPGSCGGAVFMNARCYGKEFADILTKVEYINTKNEIEELVIDKNEWEYKKTPFMGRLKGSVILCAYFSFTKGNKEAIVKELHEHEKDRIQKGHFDYPCAGSMFKNNRAFGRPTGAILDELGFRGRRIGDAMVSQKHANIFVNAGKASCNDMIKLIEEAKKAAFDAFGFELETEVIIC